MSARVDVAPLAADMVGRTEDVQDVQARVRHLVRTHYAIVWRALRAFGVARADADDAAQQVFWIAARKISAIAVGAERSFLFSTARGVAANVRRVQGRKREIADEDAMLAMLDARPNAEEALDDHRARVLLDHVISLLEDELREVFVLFELEEMSTPEIAAVLELPVGTVASRLRRAREEFHAHVRRLHARSGNGTGASGGRGRP